MVARRHKLLAAGVVLAIGAALAWPLRRSEPIPSGRLGLASPNKTESHAAPSADAAPTVEKPDGALDAELAAMRRNDDGDPYAHVPPATTAPTSDAGNVFSTISNGSAGTMPLADADSAPQVHVVHEGDSLDRLARRYLGDEGRALEIFDLNRDLLDNPHVLQIGVELRIPPVKPIAN